VVVHEACAGRKNKLIIAEEVCIEPGDVSGECNTVERTRREPVAPSTIYAPLVDSVAVMVPLPEKPAANPSAATPVKVKSKVSSTGLL
jgi:hypothetical protein